MDTNNSNSVTVLTADEIVKQHQKKNEDFKSIINAQSNDITRENANMNADTPAGMMMKFASETTKEYVDEELLSPDVLKYVKNNIIHIHDKDYYPTKSTTCVQTPLDIVLKTGFVTGHASIRPAKHIETAAMLACISMETSQNEQHGGQSIPAFDFYMAPYVRMTYIEELKKIEKLNGESYEQYYQEEIKDYIKKELDGLTGIERIKQAAINETIRRVHQSMESFVHNMNNIHSRGGNQVVFSSVNYGTDTSAEGRCIIRELLNTTYEGVGDGETAIFPIQIWKVKSGVNYLPEDPNYDLYEFACAVTARRFFPNFINLDATFNQDEDWDANDPKRYIHEVATMGCRTRVFENRFGPKTSIGRGNLSFTTLNLPKIAIEAALATGSLFKNAEGKLVSIFDKSVDTVSDTLKKDITDRTLKIFFDDFSKYLDVAAKQLDDRYQFQRTALAKQFPLLMSKLWIGSDKLNPDDVVGDIINQGTLGIGFIGLAECLVALIGKHHGESNEAQELGLKIITFMRDKINDFCEQYKHNYSVLATPAEGLAGKFTKIDQKEYGKIAGVTDRDYYTNSNHVPVYYTISANKKAKIEAPYHNLARGGHIFYVEIDGDATHNPEVVMGIVDLMHKNNMGYGSVNHNRNRCMDCGYENADKNMTVCPKCGSHNIDKIARITGYLVGTTSRWNHGKLSELNDRVTHNVDKK